ncbi:hypothetical protein OF001_U30027 [Pseudomonas sp. OF001]|nr:hypothetical protein OF001_U30027 [Pseudomonas sp. OF001]
MPLADSMREYLRSLCNIHLF